MNLNLIRDILLQVETKKFLFPKYVSSNLPRPQLKFLDKYSSEEILYHIDIIEQEKWIKCRHLKNAISVEDLSAKGHFFLADIRDNNVWEKTTETAKIIGISSLSAIKDIAVQVSSNLITNYFK